MIAKTLQRQKALYEWIVRKLTERNSDNYFVYDMETHQRMTTTGIPSRLAGMALH